MLSDKEKIKQLEEMLRQSQKKLELSEKKRRQAEEQVVRAGIKAKRVEDRIDSGDVTLAAVLSILNKAIDKLLSPDLVDLPHERLRVLKELLLEVQFDVSDADQISGMLRYLKHKGSEKAKKLLRENAQSIPAKIDGMWQAIGGAIRSVDKQEKVLADTFDATGQAAKLAAKDDPLDSVVQACSNIAAACKATPPLKTVLSQNDLLQTLGRQTVKAKLDAPTVCAIGTDGFTCPNCGKSDSWRHLGTQKNFLRTLNESSAELLRNLNTNYDLYVCECGQRHLHMPHNAPIPVTPQATISQDLAIEVGVAMTRGIPVHRLEAVLCTDNEQIGSDTLGRNAHRMVQEGALAPLVEKLQETLHGQIGGIVDETPLDILQQEGKSRKAVESRSKQGYVMVQNSLPHEEQQVALYKRLDGRSLEVIAEAMSNWDPTLLVSDGYQPYKTLMAKEDATGKLRRHQVCVIHWRRLVLTAIRELGQLSTTSESPQVIAAKIKAHDPFRLLSAVGAALSNIYHEETNGYKKRENESVEQQLARIHAGRQAHARPLMDSIDKIMHRLGREFAEKTAAGKYKAAPGKNETVSNAVVYYLNSREELRAFLDEPRLVPDTNRSERAVRALTVLRAASGFKQSTEFADSMCGWFTLVETAKANGIDNPVLWLKQYSRAWAQHVIDETHTKLGDQLNPERKLVQYDPDAMASFDVTPWLPWNYAKRMKQKQAQ